MALLIKPINFSIKDLQSLVSDAFHYHLNFFIFEIWFQNINLPINPPISKDQNKKVTLMIIEKKNYNITKDDLFDKTACFIE